jgi:hypothetical protein
MATFNDATTGSNRSLFDLSVNRHKYHIYAELDNIRALVDHAVFHAPSEQKLSQLGIPHQAGIDDVQSSFMTCDLALARVLMMTKDLREMIVAEGLRLQGEVVVGKIVA